MRLAKKTNNGCVRKGRGTTGEWLFRFSGAAGKISISYRKTLLCTGLAHSG